MSVTRYRSISEILSEFLTPIKSGYKFKKSETVISDLIGLMIHKLGGMQNLPSIDKSKFISQLLDSNETGIYKHNDRIVISTRFGSVTENSNFCINNKLSLNSVDGLVKMLEYDFTGDYPGSYTAEKWKISIIDSKFGNNTKKEPSSEWQRFYLIKQLNDVMYPSKPSEYRYLLSLVEVMQGIEHSNRISFIKEHIKFQLSIEKKNAPKEVQPTLLKYLQYRAILSYETLTYEMIDPQSLANAVFTDHDLIITRPLIHDAIAISSGDTQLLSVSKLFNNSSISEYIELIKDTLNKMPINDPNLESTLIDRVGREVVSNIHEHIRNTLLFTELHEELATYEMGM